MPITQRQSGRRYIQTLWYFILFAEETYTSAQLKEKILLKDTLKS